MNWTLIYQKKEYTFEELGLKNLLRKCFNQRLDVVTFEEVTPSISSEVLFDLESTITIKREGKPWFFGKVVKVPSLSKHAHESRVYELAGPWWYLENLVFQQTWKEAKNLEDPESDLISIEKGRVILGQDAHAKPMDSGAQIEEILNYAIAQGAPIEVGEIGVDVFFPFDEIKDLSCAEAIKRVLRWSPDACVWFEYLDIPKMHVTTHARMQELSIDIHTCAVDVLKITPRQDLQVPAVVLKYEKTHRNNSASWTTTEIDHYPKHATGKEFKAVCLTIELDGMRGTTLSQDIKVQHIDETSSFWWKEHLPALSHIPVEKIKIKNPTRTSVLSNELLSGTIAPWMNRQVEADTIKAYISYETEEEAVVDRLVSIRLQATDASSRNFINTLSVDEPEPSPVGLAKRLYESVNILQYEGEIVLSQEEVPHQQYLGRVINLKGLDAKWEHMHARVQEVIENIDTGTTRIVFGIAKHLGPDDLVELLRANRRRRASRRASVRAKGTIHGGRSIEQGTHGKIENSDSGPGRYKKIVFVDPENPQRKLVLNAEALTQDLTVELREEDVCENGLIRKRIVLASEPFKHAEDEQS